MQFLKVLTTITTMASVAMAWANYTEDQLDTALMAIEKGFKEDTVAYKNNPWLQLDDTIDYLATRTTWIRTNGANPYAFVIPQTFEEVALAVKELRKQNIKPRTQSGGHSYSGDSVQEDNGVTISTNKLRKIRVDKENMTVTCQGGLRLGQVYQYVKQQGYIFVAGTHFTTGLSGFTLGGGQSSRSRMYGLAIDQLLSYKMVTPDGELITITRDNEYADLFWALQGAGNGNFGVVVEYTFKIYPHEGVETHGAMQFKVDADDIYKVSKLFTEYVNYHKHLDRRISFRLDYQRDKDSYGGYTKKSITAKYAFFGPKKDAMKVLNNFFDTLPNKGKDYIDRKKVSYNEHKEWQLPPPEETEPEYPDFDNMMNPTRNAAGSVYMSLVTPVISQYIVEYFANVNGSKCNPLARHWQFTPVGGQIQAKGKTETAFWAREAEVELEFFIQYTGEHQDKYCRGEMNNFLATLEEMNKKQPGVFLGSYINHCSSGYDKYGERFWGDNFKRLQCIKEKYDPNNIFKWQYSIPLPDFECPKTISSSSANIPVSTSVTPVTTSASTMATSEAATTASEQYVTGTSKGDPGSASTVSVGAFASMTFFVSCIF
eukprot:Pgem_evm1s7848